MYQALYRKYRPKDFDSVVGQNPIIKTLKNSIKNHNFSHAYMFFGSRGTGKTTISKIFARNINCLSPVDGIACQKCDACKVSFSKDCIDIIEIDAASNNGVDEIRDLKNKISLVPSELKYKVYIIDEVHMLSIGAFNALLKTLEEPPEHAIFILATTDPQKVPETIVSRCQCFSFKRISTDVIKNRLRFVCDEEKIDIDDEVLYNIAVLSDGGMRDALGLLDKLISYSSEKITMDDFVEINGIISSKDIDDFIINVMNGNISSILNSINNFDNNGKNLIQILSQLLNYSRNLLVDYYLGEKKYDFSIEKLQCFANLLNEKMFDIKKSSNTRIYFEMLILKFINDQILSINNNCGQDNQDLTNKKIDNSNISVKSDKTNIGDEEKENSYNKQIKESSDVNLVNNDVNNVLSTDSEEEDDDEFDFNSYMDENEEEEDNYNVLSTEDVESNVPRIINLDEIMDVRVNNTLASANKELLKKEKEKFELLKDFTFDQEIGYIVCSILDSKLRAVSSENIIISYEYDSNVKQHLTNLDKIIEVYNKITNSNKNIAIISDEKWEKVKNDYISNLKNNIKYEIKQEPEVIFEELKKNGIITSSAVELFGDIVEVE